MGNCVTPFTNANRRPAQLAESDWTKAIARWGPYPSEISAPDTSAAANPTR